MHFKLHLCGDYYAVQFTSKKKRKGGKEVKNIIYTPTVITYIPHPQKIYPLILFSYFSGWEVSKNHGFHLSENLKGNKLVFRLNDTCWTKPVLFTNAKPAITCSGKNKNSKNCGFKEKAHLSAILCSWFLLNIKIYCGNVIQFIISSKKR